MVFIKLDFPAPESPVTPNFTSTSFHCMSLALSNSLIWTCKLPCELLRLPFTSSINTFSHELSIDIVLELDLNLLQPLALMWPTLPRLCSTVNNSKIDAAIPLATQASFRIGRIQGQIMSVKICIIRYSYARQFSNRLSGCIASGNMNSKLFHLFYKLIPGIE